MSTIRMPNRFHELTFTPLVQQEQENHGSRRQYDRMAHSEHSSGATLGVSERTFIALRDSFYMASVSETGWPYIQHRGGQPGFVHVLDSDSDDATIAFADLRGNKQYISLGNLEHDPRVALFFMDYPNQTRLKLLGRVEIHEKNPEAASLIASLRPANPKEVVERAVVIHVEAFDWNCPQHITPRFTQAELEPALAPLRERLAKLEAENATLREALKP
jgi:predicted pyridoxine 5'-phosphate oxidase superfamily flavin-nucleotide-binding protein